jgi:hypothetical protein
MVSTVKATTFVKPLRHGRTCPCLMLCEKNDGEQIETVVKLYSGKESTRKGLICETMASLLARDLDLTVPEPFIVEIEPDFHEGVPDIELSERFRNSPGANFGSRYLGVGYITWPQERSIPGSLMQDAIDIFAFDMIIQNPDRRKDKPNLLRKGDELAIFDHEMAFSFLYALGPDEHPWEGRGMGFAKAHVFYNGLKGHNVSMERIQGALEAIDDHRFGTYVDAIPGEWRSDSGGASERIQEYLKQARDNSKKLFKKIMEVLL